MPRSARRETSADYGRVPRIDGMPIIADGQPPLSFIGAGRLNRAGRSRVRALGAHVAPPEYAVAREKHGSARSGGRSLFHNGRVMGRRHRSNASP